MELFHRDKLLCEFDHEKFKTYADLVSHYRHVHHHAIVKCRDCGKEFIHEKDRLHHVREEHEKKIDYREHKDSYKKSKKTTSPQEEVDENRRNFSDNF
jgi:Fe2+ or Zn2+ uptake regulation protein